MQNEQLVDKLQSKFPKKRLAALEALSSEKTGAAENKKNYCNAQFRSLYSGFTPTPSMILYRAEKMALPVVGLVDYASLKGSGEFLKGLSMVSCAGYIGAGIKSRYKGMRLALQAIGVPHGNVKEFEKGLADARALKAKHVDKIRELINVKFGKYRIYLPAELRIFKTVKAKSAEHLYNALAAKVADKFPEEEKLIAFLKDELNFALDGEETEKLSDKTSTLYKSDLAEILRAHLGFKDLPETTVPAREFIELADKAGAVTVAIYNGSKIEDFLAACEKVGVKAVCLEPDKYDTSPEEFYEKAFGKGFLPLARKVIDRPRKKPGRAFDSDEIAEKYLDSALAVCGHEISATASLSDGLFSEKTVAAVPDFGARIKLFAKIAVKD